MDDLIIFDIDNVLVDTTKSYDFSIKETAEFFINKDVSFEDIKKVRNSGGFNNDWDLTHKIIKDAGFDADKEEIIRIFQKLYHSRFIKNEEWLIDNKILERLSSSYILCIFSGRPREEALYVLKKNDALSFFKIIVAMEDVSMGKPDPEGIEKIKGVLDFRKVYYFGDNIDDMKASVSGGVTGIGVLPPNDKSSEMRKLLKENGATKVIDDINHIYEVLE